MGRIVAALLFFTYVVAVAPAPLGPPAAVAAPDPERPRITDRKKGESDLEKTLRFPIRVALFPLWILDRGIEKGAFVVDDEKLIPRSEHLYKSLIDKGLYFQVGGAGDGAGFGGGVAWRMRREGVVPTIATSGSIRGYQDHSFTLDFSDLLARRLDAGAIIRYRSKPEEDFFGLGRSTSLNRNAYHLEETDAALQLGRTRGAFSFVTDFGYSKSNVFDGKDTRFPSVDELFAPEEVPGLEEGAELLFADASLALDFRDRSGCPTSGAAALASAGIFEDVEEADDFSHYRLRGELQGHLPLLGRRSRFGPRSVLSLRVRGEFTDGFDGSAVPFFRMPHLGGSSSLRGFREFRFRDERAVVANLEYRWRIQELLEAVLFLDAGQVFAQGQDPALEDFESSWGGGIRGVLRNTTVFRFEVGRSDEGTRFFFNFSPMFQVF
jgi:hypothetical protein